MILQTQNLCFAYGRQQVLHNIGFSIESGSVTCLMGPNGSGKTTLLDCFMRINKPQSGSIELYDKPLASYKSTELAKHIAYIPQIHSVTFPYTVREVIMMGRMSYASTFGEPGEDDKAACEEAIRLMGLEGFAERPYSKLSGGEIRLVLLARALCQRSEIILMDEPTAYLDFHNEMFFLESVASMVRQKGISVIMSTHSPNHGFFFESKALNTKAVLLSKGRILQCGTPSEVITEENMASVFHVVSKIYDDESGKTVAIIRSVKEEEKC